MGSPRKPTQEEITHLETLAKKLNVKIEKQDNFQALEKAVSDELNKKAREFNLDPLRLNAHQLERSVLSKMQPSAPASSEAKPQPKAESQMFKPVPQKSSTERELDQLRSTAEQLGIPNNEINKLARSEELQKRIKEEVNRRAEEFKINVLEYNDQKLLARVLNELGTRGASKRKLT